MKVKAYAKVNIFLNVFKNKKNNLHKIKSLVTLVEDFYDEIEIIENKNKDWEFNCNVEILNNKNNFVYKVMKKFKNDFSINNNFIKVYLKKNIPSKAGLAGGTSDAVATLKLLEKYFNVKIKNKDWKKYSEIIGSDSWFFIKEYRTAIVSGYGNKIKKVKDIFFSKRDLLLNKIKCDTKKVYNAFDLNYSKAWKRYNNSLFEPCLIAYPEMKKIFFEFKNIYKDISLSGSGSTFIKYPLYKK